MHNACAHSNKHFLFGRGGKDAEHQKHQADINTLLDQHQAISRQVHLLDNGFQAITTSDDPQLVKVLQSHVSDMKARFAKGRAIRSWDKLYALLFAYRDQIQVEYQMLASGVVSHVTTSNAQLVPLLHAHANTVSSFVEQGKDASANASYLPPSMENLPIHTQDHPCAT